MKNIYILYRCANGKIIFTKEQINLVISLYKDKSISEISKRFKVSPAIIRNLLKSQNVEIIGHRNRFPLNESYFSSIDTKEKAYWLGFLYADGCVHNNSNEISITLKDKEHLEKFKRAIGAINHHIGMTIDKRFKKICTIYNFSFKSKLIHSDLINLGCIEQKSLKLNKLPSINNNFMIDFIRGVFDGDGSIHYTIPYKATLHKDYRISFTGTEIFLKNINSFLKNNTKVISQKDKINTFYFQINGNKRVFDFLNMLYKDTTEENRLNRKYNIYIEFCNYLGASPLNSEI